MSSLKAILMVITVVFSGSSLEENLKQRLCSKSVVIDSAVIPFGADFLFLISNQTIFKVKVQNAANSAIEWAMELKNWSSTIKTTIHMIYTSRKNPKYISLINCAIEKEWIIRYEDNHYNGSADSYECGREVEYVMDPETGDQYFVRFFPEDNKLAITHPNPMREWIVRSADDDSNFIKAFESVQNMARTVPFIRLNGHEISAAFIHDKHWYLFGGRYYCRTKMNVFDECKPLEINKWILNCDREWVDPWESKVAKNKDLSVYIVIVTIIITIAFIVIVTVVMLTCREYRKRGSYMTQSSNYSSSV